MFAELGIPFHSSLREATGKRRSEFLAGRYCAKKTLERLGAYHCAVGVGKHRNPIWPESLIGSISHDTDMALAVSGPLSELTAVGVDIEQTVSREIMESIATEILSQNEINVLFQSPYRHEEMFTIAFSLKESFFKAIYRFVGEYFGFEAVEIRSINARDSKISFRLTKSLNSKLKAGREFEARYHLLPQGKIVTLVAIAKI